MAFASRIRKLASETAIYGLSSVLGRLLNYVLVPFYTWYFSPDEYGVVIALYAAFVFLNIVYTYGMEAAYMKYASGREGRQRVKKTFSTAAWTLLASSSLLSLLLVLFRRPVADVIGLDGPWVHLIYYAAAILWLDTMAVIPFAELRLAGRPWRFAGTRLAGIVANVVLNIVLIAGLHLDIEAILLANTLSSAVTLALLLPVYWTYLQPLFDRFLWRELLRFGWPFLPSGIGYALTEMVSRFYLVHMPRERVLALYGSWLDEEKLAAKAVEAAERVRQAAEQAGVFDKARITRMMTEAADRVYGAYVVGVFGTMYKLGIFMMLFAQMFRFAWQPFFLQHAEDSDARELFARVFTLFTAVGLFIWLAVSFWADELVSFPLPRVGYLIEPSYWPGLFIVPLILLAYLFQGWYYNFSAGLYIKKQTRYFVHNTLAGGLVTLALNMGLVPLYGMLAAAWATLLAYATMAMGLFLTARRFYPIAYEWRKIGMMAVWAGSLFALWKHMPPFQSFWMEGLLLLVFTAGLFLSGILPYQMLLRGHSTS